MHRKLSFLAPIVAVVMLLTGCAGNALAQVVGDDPTPTPRPVAKVDFETKFPSPRVVGPPPPMADIWTFDSITIIPPTGSIEAVQLVSLSQPDIAGVPQPATRIATDTVRVTADEAAAILGEAEYLDLMTRISDALHAIAVAQNKEPV